MADAKATSWWARRKRYVARHSGVGAVGYNPQDETLGDYAQRQGEQAMQAQQLDAIRAAIPQDEPVAGSDLGQDLGRLAEAFGDAEGIDEVAARLAELPDDLLPLVVMAAKIALARRDPGLPALASAVTPETNPPSWIGDEATWEKAKEAVKPRWDSYSEPYAVVTSVYENMGGSFK